MLQLYFLIFIIVVLLAIPGGYNLYLQSAKSRDEKNNTKYIFNDTGYSMPHRQVSDNSSIFWQTRKDWMGKIKNLEVVGGEPFYISKWKTLWEEMIELGYSKKT